MFRPPSLTEPTEFARDLATEFLHRPTPIAGSFRAQVALHLHSDSVQEPLGSCRIAVGDGAVVEGQQAIDFGNLIAASADAHV
jgi:hypothetical protein